MTRSSPEVNMLRIVPLLFVLGASSWAGAVSTEVWRTQSADDFQDGKLEQVVVSSDGEVSLGRQTRRVKLGGTVLAWSTVLAGQDEAFVGTGPKGTILQVSGLGSPGTSKVKKLFRTKDFVVTALALDGKGHLYAGTIPKGRLYRIDTQTGKGTLYATLPAKYIWALAWDPAGYLVAGTGPEGKLFKIEAGGKVSLLYDSKEKHLLSLARAKSGDFYVGSSPKAILFKVSPQGKAQVIHDFKGDEVRAIALHQDQILVAVNDIRGKPRLGTYFFGTRRRSSSSVLKTKAKVKVIRAKGKRRTRRRVSRGGTTRLGRGAIYRIDGAGRVERLLDMPKGYFTSLAADRQGAAWAGSGAEGRVFRITSARRLEVMHDFKEKQILSLALRPDGSGVIGTGNGAAAYVTSAQQADRGKFLSMVFDARFPSRWGKLRWRATGKLKFRTRAGNTKTPDGTWSPWTEPVGETPFGVASPRARYLQYRVDLGDDPAAVLREVEVYYLQQNQRPRITRVKVSGASGSRSFLSLISISSSSSGSKAAKTPRRKGAKKVKTKKAPTKPSGIPRHQPVRKITWRVDNPDGDRLVYWVYIRERGSPHWILLNQKRRLTKRSYRWNTENVPDGHYLVKVRVSDERSNPHELALQHERISSPILVDNNRPGFRNLKIDPRTLEVTCEARDSYSVLRRVEYNVDGDDWELVHPIDGLLDDRVEKFRFRLRRKPSPGAHTLTLRVRDSDGNIGTANLVFQVK